MHCKFQGIKTNLNDFKATLDDFNGKGVIVETFGDYSTFHCYDDFRNDTCNNTLVFQDNENDDKPSLSIPIKNILSVIEGIGVYFDHYLVQLQNHQNIFIHRM